MSVRHNIGVSTSHCTGGQEDASGAPANHVDLDDSEHIVSRSAIEMITYDYFAIY